MNANSCQEEVVKNIERFLCSEKKSLMERCFCSIRNSNNERCFKESIKVISNEKFDALFPLVSLVVLTANKIECDSFNYIFSAQKEHELNKRMHAIPILGNSHLGAPDAYIIKMNFSYILHLNAYDTGSNTPGGSSDLTRFVLNNKFLNPTCIISFGVCYGRNPLSQNIGDVLMPRKIYPWSIGQKICEGKMSIKHDNFSMWLEKDFSFSGIYSILNDFCNGEEGKTIREQVFLKDLNRRGKKKASFDVKVFWGNISTGEAVISSSKAKLLISKANHIEKELGGEMEAYGIAKECIFYGNIPCVVVKAICDWGELKDINSDLKKYNVELPVMLKDKLQAYAAFCAGVVLQCLLEQQKDKFLSLALIRKMRKNNRIKPCNWYKKEKILSSIRSYYKVDIDKTEQIFQLLEKHGILIKDSDAYSVTTNI